MRSQACGTLRLHGRDKEDALLGTGAISGLFVKSNSKKSARLKHWRRSSAPEGRATAREGARGGPTTIGRTTPSQSPLIHSPFRTRRGDQPREDLCGRQRRVDCTKFGRRAAAVAAQDQRDRRGEDFIRWAPVPAGQRLAEPARLRVPSRGFRQKPGYSLPCHIGVDRGLQPSALVSPTIRQTRYQIKSSWPRPGRGPPWDRR